MKNKKGLSDIFKIILTFGIIVIIGMFIGLFSKNLMNDVVSESADQFKDYALDLDPIIGQTIDDLEVNFLGYDMKLDLFFTIIWIIAIIGTMLFAYFTEPLPKYNLFTFLFIGLLFSLFVFDILAQIMNYLFENLIVGVFTATETNLPTFIFYMENKWKIITVWILSAVIVNQIRNVFSTIESRLQEVVE